MATKLSVHSALRCSCLGGLGIKTRHDQSQGLWHSKTSCALVDAKNNVDAPCRDILSCAAGWPSCLALTHFLSPHRHGIGACFRNCCCNQFRSGFSGFRGGRWWRSGFRSRAAALRGWRRKRRRRRQRASGIGRRRGARHTDSRSSAEKKKDTMWSIVTNVIYCCWCFKYFSLLIPITVLLFLLQTSLLGLCSYHLLR